MPAPNILVVVVDGLRASALGAYGNTTYATPALDQFASEALLFDACFSPAVDLAAIYGTLWQSRHPVRPIESNYVGGNRSLPGLLAEQEFQTALITDEPELLQFESAKDFHECTLLECRDDADSRAQGEEVLSTNIGRLFANVAESISGSGNARRSESSRLIWVHSRGMYGPWDAPLDLQESLSDDDTPPITSNASPQLKIGVDEDPDTMFRYATAYSAQVVVFDFAWQLLMNATDSAGNAGQPWLVVLLGSRGFPLGEDGAIGGVDSRLTSAQLHVPWLIRFPNGRGKLDRSHGLVSQLDLLPTLLDAIKSNVDASLQWDGMSLLSYSSGNALPNRDLLLATSNTAVAVRTPRWCFRTIRASDLRATASTDQIDADEMNCELFVRPDDRWEANDVSKLCPEVIDELKTVVQSTLRALET